MIALLLEAVKFGVLGFPTLPNLPFVLKQLRAFSGPVDVLEQLSLPVALLPQIATTVLVRVVHRARITFENIGYNTGLAGHPRTTKLAGVEDHLHAAFWNAQESAIAPWRRYQESDGEYAVRQALESSGSWAGG